MIFDERGESMGKKPDRSKQAICKGEEGYWERNTEAAHKAAAAASAAFETAEQFQTAADAYFDECDAEGKLYGEAGLCLGLTKYGPKKRIVTMDTLRKWHDGVSCAHLQEVVKVAYMRIAEQVETDERYQQKAMATRGIFMQKQARFGGYQDKVETKNDTTVKIVFGDNSDSSDYK